jgi:sugar/nucleoside kinase (ribokinase family)
VTAVVVVGDVMVDVVAQLDGPLRHASDTPARIALRPGGSAANVAAWLASTGAAVTLAGRVGDDAAGRDAGLALRDAGVDARLAVDTERPTGTCVVLVGPDGERSMLPDPGANDALAAADLPRDRFTAGAHLHVAGYALLRSRSRAGARAALALAREVRMTTSLDPSSAAPLAAVGPARFLAWAGPVELLLPNAAEAATLAGSRDPAAAARMLGAHAREVVVTLGADGALWSDGRQVARERAAPGVAVVDSTGAGDAFAAGFLGAWLAGSAPQLALAAGCRLAERAVGLAGARP